MIPADRLICIPQERVDYQKEENRDQTLMEIYERTHSDPYVRTLNYIAVLEGLTLCRALLANVACGAVTYALARDTDYEFVDVPDFKQGNNRKHPASFPPCTPEALSSAEH